MQLHMAVLCVQWAMVSSAAWPAAAHNLLLLLSMALSCTAAKWPRADPLLHVYIAPLPARYKQTCTDDPAALRASLLHEVGGEQELP